MSIFIDTNISVAHTIIHDKWHDPAKKIIDNTQDSIFWSTLVKKEYRDTVDNIIDDTEIFLKQTREILENNEKDFINYTKFENYILKRTKDCELDRYKKQKILEHFWEKNNIIEGISRNIYEQFEKFAKNFEKIYYNRIKLLDSRVSLHDCGLDNFLKYKAYAKALHDWGIHKPDCKIIVDAHDCGKTHDNLIFVSTDAKMTGKIITHNTSFLNIIEFKSCN